MREIIRRFLRGTAESVPPARVVAAFFAMTLAAVGSPSLSQDFSRSFDWPNVDDQAIPDARLRDILIAAVDEAEQAAEYSRQGISAASRANRLVRVRSAIGRGPQPQIVGDGVTMSAVAYGDEGGSMFGELAWASGATMTGALSQSMGEYRPPLESSVQRFTGFVFGTTNPDAVPMTGDFEFKTGDHFVGSFNTGRNALGVYASADGALRFVGEIDFYTPAFRPIRGNLLDRNGRTLAVVREP